MPTSRRDFLRSAAATAVLAGCGRTASTVDTAPAPSPQSAPPSPTTNADASVRDLAMEGLNAAKDAGASYADVRFGRYRRQSVNTREHQVTNVSDSESYGVGVRALV